MSDAERLVADRYRLSRRIGRGGMGTVWLARDELLDRPVAVKKLHVPPHLDDDERARLYERTRREARSAARISHPAVIVVHDVVEDEGLPCVVMEYVPSRSLGDVLREDGPLAPEAAARVGVAMAVALRAAHAAGVLHRDVKPANVLLSDDGERVVLTDFGIAAASGTSTLTRTGEFIGSIDYAAPERMQGGESAPEGDAWALGATLYQAVEGVPPFRRDSWMETAYATASEPPRPMRSAGELAPVIEGLLAKQPASRLTLRDAAERLSSLSGTVALPGGHGPSGGDEGGEWRETRARTPPEPYLVREGPSGEHDAPRGREQDPAPEAGTGGRTGSGTGAGGTAGGGRRRRGLRVLAGVVAAALVAGGGWWLLRIRDDGGSEAAPSPSASHAGSPSTGPSPSLSPLPPVAKGFRRVHDPAGFSVDVPDDWTRQERPGGEEVDYLAPSGLVGLKFSVLDFADDDPLEHWRDLEAEVRSKSPGYHRLRMNATRYQGGEAALWEYTWQGRARTFHAKDLGFGRPGGRHYAVYLSAPHADWPDDRRYFDIAQATFRAADSPDGEAAPAT